MLGTFTMFIQLFACKTKGEKNLGGEMSGVVKRLSTVKNVGMVQ